MTQNGREMSWGESPWIVDFEPERQALPEEVDFAIIGGGFTGLAAAAWLRRIAPGSSVVVLEGTRLGSGASGRTGGIALPETAMGDLPGLGDVLKGFKAILDELELDCELNLSGVWEIARTKGLASSPIKWEDSGSLRVVKEVSGGTINPGKLVSGLARAAQRLGAILVERAPVSAVLDKGRKVVKLLQGEVRPRRLLFATNAQSLELNGLAGRASPKFTLAVATAPLTDSTLEAVGLAERKAFYTLDLPYLWGRVLPDNGVIFGSGLVDVNSGQDFDSINVTSGRAEELLRNLTRRVHALHPALRSVELTHRWGGPLLFPETGRPFFLRHARLENAFVLGGYSGQGVSLSVYLGCWAAEVLAGAKTLPAWGG